MFPDTFASGKQLAASETALGAEGMPQFSGYLLQKGGSTSPRLVSENQNLAIISGLHGRFGHRDHAAKCSPEPGKT